MDAIKAANLGLAFLLELGGLAALGYWGYQTGTGPLRWVLAIGAPLLLAVIWGVFLSPQATVRLPETLTTTLRTASAADRGSSSQRRPAHPGGHFWRRDRDQRCA
jgi:hypothetical protein